MAKSAFSRMKRSSPPSSPKTKEIEKPVARMTAPFAHKHTPARKPAPVYTGVRKIRPIFSQFEVESCIYNNQSWIEDPSIVNFCKPTDQTQHELVMISYRGRVDMDDYVGNGWTQGFGDSVTRRGFFPENVFRKLSSVEFRRTSTTGKFIEVWKEKCFDREGGLITSEKKKQFVFIPIDLPEDIKSKCFYLQQQRVIENNDALSESSSSGDFNSQPPSEQSQSESHGQRSIIPVEESAQSLPQIPEAIDEPQVSLKQQEFGTEPLVIESEEEEGQVECGDMEWFFNQMLPGKEKDELGKRLALKKRKEERKNA